MQPAADDLALLHRIAQGDAEALRALYEAQHARLWRYLWYALAGDAGLVEEVLQDVFVAVWQAAATYQGTAQPTTWLFQIAHNRAANARRARERHADVVPLVSDAAATEAGGMAGGDLEEAVLTRLALGEALHHLAPHHQAVLNLFFYQGFSLQEIAQILGVPVGTVKSRINHARRAMAQAMAVEEAGEHGE